MTDFNLGQWLSANPGLAVLSLLLLLSALLILVGLLLAHSMERLKRLKPLPADEPPTALAQAVESLTMQRDQAQGELVAALDCEDKGKVVTVESELARLDAVILASLGTRK